MKFSEFNRAVNPNDENVYCVESSAFRGKALNINEVKKLAQSHPDTIIKMALPKGYVVIKTNEKVVVKIIQDTDCRAMVVEFNGEYYLWFRGNLNKNTEHNLLACGLDADIYAKKGTEVVVPFLPPNSTNKVTLVYEKGIDDYPKWLTPLKKDSSPVPIGIQIPIVNNAQTILHKHLKNILGFNKYDQEDIIRIINKYFFVNPITDDEIRALLEAINNSLLASFMDKGQLMHWELGDYVIEACNIKRDKVSKELYFYNDKNKIYTNDEGYLTGYLTKLLPQLKQYQKEETIKYIYNKLYSDAVEFNTQEYTVVFRNGILDLSTRTFEPMSPDHYESIQIDAEYDPNAYSATADEFFATATCGDKDVEQLLYEAIGYTMLKTNALAKSFILTGTGRNGKSTYLDVIKTILGHENYASLSFKDLSSTFRVSQLKNKLGSLAGDISAQPIQESDLFKSISAFEDITLEEKYKQSYTAKLFSTMIFACNKLPRTPDTSPGFYRRMVIIPFNADLSQVSSVDGITFKNKLLSKESINYIAYKALDAIYNVLNSTMEFTEPQCVKDMLTKYKVDNSTVLSWFSERFNKDIKAIENTPINQAYGNYTAWCTESGRIASSKTTFRQQVEAEIGILLKDK